MRDDSQAELRRQGLRMRRALTPEQRARASQRITDRLFQSNLWYAARNVACYISTRDEVDTNEVFLRAWRMQKRIFAPVVGKRRQLEFREITRDSDLQRSQFGLFEPVAGSTIETSSLDLVLTPVVAFDARLQRIGMGGGYYDFNFRQLRERKRYLPTKLLGIAFECQEVLKIKANPWDIRLHAVITERGLRYRTRC